MFLYYIEDCYSAYAKRYFRMFVHMLLLDSLLSTFLVLKLSNIKE